MMFGLYSEDPGNERITEKKISQTVRELRNNPNEGRIIIFEKGKAIVGYSILIFYWSNEYGGEIVHIDELYVRPEHRGRGVATSFFKHILRISKGKAAALQLEVTPSNRRARNYYQKMGFKNTRNLHLIRSI